MSKFFWCGGFSSKFGAHDLDSEEYDVVEKRKDLLTWNIPRIRTRNIYRRELFSFSSDFCVSTGEGKVSLDEGGASMKLISENDLWYHQHEYDLIHAGMVQIGVKTLTRKPLNASVVLCLRDVRYGNLEDSLLAMVESSLSDGPIYFNVFPNITESLSHPQLSDILFLDAKIKDFELPEGPKHITLMFRICYKVLKSGSATNALLQSPTGKTVFFQTDLELSNTAVQKVTEWDQVRLPENWPPPPQKWGQRVCDSIF